MNQFIKTLKIIFWVSLVFVIAFVLFLAKVFVAILSTYIAWLIVVAGVGIAVYIFYKAKKFFKSGRQDNSKEN